MKNKELLRKIYYENKVINRNLQRLINISLMGVLGQAAKEAKESDDSKGKLLVRVGLILLVITQGLLMISDIMDYREQKNIEEK